MLNWLKKKECTFDSSKFERIVLPGGNVVILERDTFNDFDKKISHNKSIGRGSDGTESYRIDFLDMSKAPK